MVEAIGLYFAKQHGKSEFDLITMQNITFASFDILEHLKHKIQFIAVEHARVDHYMPEEDP